jgi:hypothetical protein
MSREIEEDFNLVRPGLWKHPSGHSIHYGNGEKTYTVMNKYDRLSKHRTLNGAKKSIINKMKLKEDAPVNNAGGGNVAGLGVGPQGEPGRSSSLMFKRGKFAGKDTFIVPTKMFHKGQLSKKKGQHWKSYFTEDEGFNEIREFAIKNPKKAIILQDENTGALYVAKYGSNV